MDLLSRYPIISQIMDASNSKGIMPLDSTQEPGYKDAVRKREKLYGDLEEILLQQDGQRSDGRERLKKALYSIEEATDDMEVISEYYSFIAGFRTCAKLFAEMIG